jgi:hypothetical protein
MAVFAKLRHFSEYHTAIGLLVDLHKCEASLVQSQGKTFGEEFRRFAKLQKEDIAEAITSISTAGAQQFKLGQETIRTLQNLPRDLEPLLRQETARTKVREQCADAQVTAEKSAVAAEKAEAALSRIQGTGKPLDVGKAEVAASQARKKSDEDRTTADTLKQKLEESEGPYRHKFLESLVTPLTASFDARYKAAEKALEIAADIETAADKIHEIEDPAIANYQKILDELENVVIE